MTGETSQKRRLSEHEKAIELTEKMHERLVNGELDDMVFVAENIEELDRLVDVTGREMMEAAERMREEREARTDGGRTKRHGREYARQQARDHRAMQRRNYLRDGRTSGGRRL